MRCIWGDNQYKGEKIPEAFANFLKTKVIDISSTCRVDGTVYNGALLLNAADGIILRPQ